jgi:hypothetical protein
MTTAQPGWYADAQRDDTERWFDGTTWTDARRPTATQDVPASRRATGWLPVAVAFLALLVLLCGGALVLAGAALDTANNVVAPK